MLLVIIIGVGVLRVKLYNASSGGVTQDADAIDPRAMLSTAQIAQFRSAFNSINADGSGDVNVRELHTALKKSGTKLSEAEALLLPLEQQRSPLCSAGARTPAAIAIGAR